MLHWMFTKINVLYFLVYKNCYANNIRNEIISENKAMASVSANPIMAILNKSFLRVGFLAIPNKSAPKINPIPIPAPVSPDVASPAPIFCAACSSIKI